MTIELFVDTCAMLDLVRAPVRTEFHPTYASGARDILLQAQSQNPPVQVIWTDVTRDEYQEHVGEVSDEARRLLRQIRDRYQQALTVIGGFSGQPPSAALDDASIDAMVGQARGLADSFVALATSHVGTQDDLNKAAGRVFKAIAPARKGKGSLADCVITEVALRCAASAGNRGITKSVFFSSNTHDYCEGGQLKPSLQTEFDAVGLVYVRNWGEARHAVLTPAPAGTAA